MASSPSIWSVARHYAWVFAISALVLNLALWALRSQFGLLQGVHVFGWLPPVIRAVATGRAYGRTAGQAPSNGFAWKAGFGFVAMALLLLGLATLIAEFVPGLGFGESFARALHAVGPGADGVLIVFAAALVGSGIPLRFLFAAAAHRAAGLR